MTEDYSAWVGRRQEASDVLEPARTLALSAALGADGAECAILPLLHHWLYFWDVRSPTELGPDGHPARGGFLPPVSLPRRMWAGGRVNFLQPLRVGDAVSRSSTILKVEAKPGQSGALVFVTVQHEIAGFDGVAIREEQDIVYRDPPPASAAPGPIAAAAEPSASAWRYSLEPDPILLFRYSALTMNSHRIHYDRPYAMSQEGYPALVVHGPLQATLLAALAQERLPAPISTFEYRGLAPAFDGAPLELCGEPAGTGAEVWAEQGGRRIMSAKVGCQ